MFYLERRITRYRRLSLCDYRSHKCPPRDRNKEHRTMLSRIIPKFLTDASTALARVCLVIETRYVIRRSHTGVTTMLTTP